MEKKIKVLLVSEERGVISLLLRKIQGAEPRIQILAAENTNQAIEVIGHDHEIEFIVFMGEIEGPRSAVVNLARRISSFTMNAEMYADTGKEDIDRKLVEAGCRGIIGERSICEFVIELARSKLDQVEATQVL